MGKQHTQQSELTHAEIARYSRHLLMPEVGLEGQKKLKQARVLVIGAGGLGSPISMYLAAAGVGCLGLVDYDVVDQSNLQRQTLFSDADIDRPKVEVAQERLAGINPHADIRLHRVWLTSDNALEIIGEYDLVIDGTDNFPTRYLVNDACVLLKKPLVYGSIYRFDGQVSVFDSRRGPCYRCLYPAPPPPEMVPSCAEGGVLGVLPGIIGSLQANEALKLILEQGDPLVGRLILFDALRFSFDELKLRKNANCPVCGDQPSITELIDYEEFCGVPAADHDSGLDAVHRITPIELQARRQQNPDLFVLDVRDPHESAISTLGGQLIPVNELPQRLDELADQQSREIVVYCRTGSRSARATKLLLQNGFTQVRNLEGGINAWAEQIDPSLPVY